ncbi:MAG TPA: SDR family NAD(P)-dependent oxidoreductase [Pirellulaceae bacterium]|nr:SDR family NAD(P)-dependent oxidoreductase [Pirellulaceae bacterium]HMO93003.1 SDR family NAD(P)-dependent oxidoreductase [Pirellulaceae bacterium]HMP67919.1 SDR family NAD(P)-dependent oxidoreductase [Pirellulaceae bacterium]
MARRDLVNQRIVITGASSGIGTELARQLWHENARILITARRKERLESLSNELLNQSPSTRRRANQSSDGPADLLVVVGDVTDSAVRTEIIETAVSNWGGIDVLINNAGVGAIGPFVDASPQRLRSIMEVNFFAPAELIRLAVPHMHRSKRPMVVNISSVLGHRAVPLKSEYCASKFAMHGLSDAIRSELDSLGIDVLLVSPSTTASEFFDAVIDNSIDNYQKLSTPQSSAHVAKQAIKAMKRGKNEIILSFSGTALVWLDRLFPTLANKLVARFGK